MQQIVIAVINSLVMISTTVLFGYLTLENKNNIKTKSDIKIVSFIVAFIVSVLNVIFCDKDLRTIITFINYVILFNYYHFVKLSSAIFITFIYMILLMIPDMLQLFFVIYVFNMSKEYCYTVFAGSVLSNLLICIFLLIITLLFRKSLKKLFNLNIEKSRKVIVLSVFTILCIIILFFDIITNYKDNNGIFSYIVLICVFLLILISLIYERLNYNRKIMEYDNLLKFMKMYEEEIEKNKIQNHEVKNQFITIKSMLRDNAAEKDINSYIDSIVLEKQEIDNIQYSDLQYLPLNGLKGLICYKISQAEKYNIEVSVIIDKEIEKSFISNFRGESFKQLGRLLGVYLDNAIEASRDSEAKTLGIEIHNLENGILIVIINSFANEIKKDEVTGRRISSKSSSRGHGLKLADKIITKNKRYKVENEIIGKTYIQRLMIKKIK